MNMLPPVSLQILQGTLRYLAHYGIVIPYPSAQNSVMVAASAKVLGCPGPLYDPRYVIWRVARWYILPKPHRYVIWRVARWYILPKPHRYVIWRKPLRYLAQTLPGRYIGDMAWEMGLP